MEIKTVNKEDYTKLIINPFSKFDTAEFIELNKTKVENIVYFIFNNGKNRFGLAGGIKDKTLKFPFSATFCNLSEITHGNRIDYYTESIEALINWSKNNNISEILFNTPPIFYDIPHITKLQNALINCGFKILDYDVNFEFYLDNFDENYLNNIHRNARKNYNHAVKNNLYFEKTEDIKTVYNIIKCNREFKGYPLWMSLDDVINTSKIIKSDYFLVSSTSNEALASAVVHHIKENIVRVVYWGNTPEGESYRPINFLSYNLFKYYKAMGIKIVDIGTSTLNSIPNSGLCDFKESIGCNASPKLSFRKDL